VDEVLGKRKDNVNDGGPDASDTDNGVGSSNLGPEDTCGTRIQNPIIHDDNPSIQNDGNRSKATQSTHDAKNNKISHEENNPSIHNDENHGSTYDADILGTADDKTNVLPAETQQSPSEEKSEIFCDESRVVTKEKEGSIETGEDLKTADEKEPV
jgi:hypothetical protein